MKFFKDISILIIVLFFINILNSIAFAGGCWSRQEVEDLEFAELEGKMVFSFKDAVTCKPVSNAMVMFGPKKLKTDSFGRIVLPVSLFERLNDAIIPIKVEKKGYITLKTRIRVMAGTVWDKFFLLTRKLPANSARFVLVWGKKPRDLDLHLVSRDFHISYRNMKSYSGKAELDRDDTNGYGPETITLQKIEPHTKYTLYVHNYSNDAKINPRARVYVYINNKLDRVIDLPKTDKRVVKILEIKNKQIFYFNTPCSRIR